MWLNNLWFDAQSLTTICIVHVGTSGNHILWLKCPSIAGFAVDYELALLCWVFPTNHAQKATVVGASPVTVHFPTWYQVLTQAPGYFHFPRHAFGVWGRASTVGIARVEGVLGDPGSPGKFCKFGYKHPYSFNETFRVAVKVFSYRSFILLFFLINIISTVIDLCI